MSQTNSVVCLICGRRFTTTIEKRNNYYTYRCYCPDCAAAYEEALR